MLAADALSRALNLVDGERARTHGDKYINHSKIAALWNAYLVNAGKLRDDAALDATDVALLMLLLKIARTQSGGAHNDDNFVDMAGYAGVAAETAAIDR